MGKYIVELKKNETLYKAATRESDGTAYVCSAIGTPYTEPDLEQVRKEAYADGYNTGFGRKIDAFFDASYQEGLADAWEAVRKIYNFDLEEREELFHDSERFNVGSICEAYSASEAIEKIRQYEQEQDRQARIEYNFDEIKDVLETTAKECNVSLDEIAAVLEKMRENNG